MVVRRHWFGFFNLVAAALGLLALLGLIIVFFPLSGGSVLDQQSIWLIILVGLMFIFMLAGLFLAMWHIYFSNQLILTHGMVSQKVQMAIFKDKQSQLGLANIEDVTSARSGFFQTTLGFGTLTIETAGEQNNFQFRYCPHPERCAKIIMEVRSGFLADNPDVVSKLR